MAERDGRPLLLDRHRRPARHRPRVRAIPRRDALRHRRPSGRRRRNARVREGESRARRGDRRGGDPALRRLARQPRSLPTVAALREHGDGDRRPGPGRERAAAGSPRRAARPRARRGDRPRRRCNACCTSRRSGCALAESGHGRAGAAARAVRARRGARRTSPRRRGPASGRRPPAARRASPAAEDRHARQRARARAGRARVARGARRPRRARPRSRRPATATAPRSTRSAGSRELDVALLTRRDRPRRALRQGRPRRAAGRPRARRHAAARDAADAICGAPSLDALPAGARVGTSSLRRTAQIRALREDVEVAELRGNVDTRLAKLEGGEYARSCWRSRVCSDSGARTPRRARSASSFRRPDQGVLVLAARTADAQALGAVAALDDPETHACLRAERALVGALEADCHTPVGAHAVLEGARDADAERIRRPHRWDAWVRDTLMTTATEDPEALGAQRRCAARLRCGGRGRGPRAMSPGRVHLVGAGPGDPALLTAARRRADRARRRDPLRPPDPGERAGAMRARTPNSSTSARRAAANRCRRTRPTRCSSSTRARGARSCG